MLVDQIQSTWGDVAFTVEAELAGDGFASVTEVRIDGRVPLRAPSRVPRADTLGQALDWGVYYAICEIEQSEDRPFVAGW